MKMSYWNRFCPTLFGEGVAELAGEKAKELGMSKIMVVTEADLIKFQVATKVIDCLKAAGYDPVVFDCCKADAPSDICDEGAKVAVQNAVDGIVAVGGGSSLDTAKAIGIVVSMGGTTICDYYQTSCKDHKIKLICIATTAGTGSENSQYAVIGDSKTGVKQVPEYSPDLAIVDPVMTYTLPKSQTASTGMDALAHCAEAITSKNWNPYVYTIGAAGIRIAMKYLPISVKEPDNALAREKMAFAANLGGLVILESGCQMGHAFSQSFGGKYHVPHGLGCAWGFPGSMVYAAQYGDRESAEVVAEAMGVSFDAQTPAETLAKRMGDKAIALMQEIGIPTLKASGYSLEDALSIADVMAKDAAIANAPGEHNMDQIKAYITYTYDAYQ
ncbi:iron-containing alcohol dehydrogenase [Pseudoramibacter faecis]|uniref:iron-containing alcohol dehydrogenase n=1 Tax=Pseudoramibacter faecis TaxID=3108534 RepID=UPI002E790BD8|nr:iron-containing alcohol dehydrogenase [Pseudoramibacter sp. HA2172]